LANAKSVLDSENIDSGKAQDDLKRREEEMLAEIGRLNMQVNWLKKNCRDKVCCGRIRASANDYAKKHCHPAGWLLFFSECWW